MNDETARIDPPAGDDEPVPRRRLRRSSEDRVLAGVAGGLGRHLGVDPIIFRIGFVLSLFFGGLGALAYVLLALFVPTDGAPDLAQRIGRPLRRSGVWRAIGIALVVLLAVMGLVTLAAGGAFATALGWGVPVAVGVIVIGAVLALTAFRGGARWLIPPVLAVVIGAGAASATDLDFRGGIGERVYTPVSAGSIPADGYKLGVGRLAIDMRDVDWRKDSVVHLKVRLGTGQADVLVPEKVCVAGHAHVGAGESEVAGERNDGFDVDHAAGSGSTATPRLELDAKVDIGQLRVINDDTADVSDPGYRVPFDNATGPLRAAEQRACATP
jgi:phage shock protein PspC (stress-responsive transcriptional regulator)